MCYWAYLSQSNSRYTVRALGLPPPPPLCIVTFIYEAAFPCILRSQGLKSSHFHPLSFVSSSFNFVKDYRQSGSLKIWTTSLLWIPHSPHFPSNIPSLSSSFIWIPNLFVPLLVLWAVRCICLSAATHPSAVGDAHPAPLYFLGMTCGLLCPLLPPCPSTLHVRVG